MSLSLSQEVHRAVSGEGVARVEEPSADCEQGHRETEGRRGGAGDAARYSDVRGGHSQGLPAGHISHGQIPGTILLFQSV